ncbi:FCD domain-containing protein [Streptosporangium sp. NPDC051022]|uniref:FCD domain-containing protein n=1 Tax=Streptosporangium sp. NPDC051022 TaxID=3155752 RepID=UPI0034259699
MESAALETLGYQPWQEFSRAHAAVTRTLDENLQRECGMPLRWFEALAVLTANEGRAVVQQDLSNALTMSQSAVSRLVTRMEQEGLVRRTKQGDDGRAVTLELTDAGAVRFRGAQARYLSDITEHFSRHLVDIDTARFVAAMRRLSGGEAAAHSPVELLGFGESVLAVNADPVAVADALHVRDALEPLLLSEAAKYRTEEDIADCRILIAQMEACAHDPEQYYRADWRLHARLAAVCRNAVLRSTYLGLLSVIEAHLDTVVRSDSDADYIQRRLAIHREMIESVASGNASRVLRAAEAHRFMGIRAQPGAPHLADHG